MKLITIDKYLTDKISKGPKASKGEIDYSYQSFENIYNFFYIMKKELSLMCLPEFNVKFDNYIVRCAVAIELETKMYWVHDDAKNAICNCDCSQRFVYISLIIFHKLNDKLAHANIIIVDLHKKQVERFEPYGWTLPTHSAVNSIVKNVILPKLGLKMFRYIPPESISEKLGIQYTGDSYNGMCITISMLYFHMRLLNPEIKSTKVVKYLLSLDRLNLKKLILKYAKYVENKLKENYKTVNQLNDNLYNNAFS